MSGLSEIQVAEAGGDYALLGEIDFAHPLFAPFADPRFSDFSHIHFWKHRRVEFPTTAGVRVLAKFDDGSPALAQVPVGKGNLLVLASGWNPADSQLAVSSKFPPFMQTLLDWSGAAAPARFQFYTGDAIPVSGIVRRQSSMRNEAAIGKAVETARRRVNRSPKRICLAFTRRRSTANSGGLP